MIAPPVTRGFLAIVCTGLLLAAQVSWSQTTDLPRKLCTSPSPDCPEAVEIPENYGVQDICGDVTAQYEYERETPLSMDPFTREVLVPPNSRIITFGRVIPIDDWTIVDSWEYPDDARIVTKYSKTIFKPGTFQVTWAGHQLHALQESDDDDDWNYYRLGKIDYTVTCLNGITYRDSYDWKVFDHDCEDEIGDDDCSDGVYNWLEIDPLSVDLNAESPFAPRLGTNHLYLPISDITTKWTGRKVGIPEYYGGPNTLANPLILVNGLGQDFRVMGAVPLTEPGTPEWTKGLVKDYVQGSLPDVVSRAYGLQKGDDINDNGIYFINIDPTVDFDHLSSADLRGYVDQISDYLRKHAGALPVSSDLKADIVCHGTGCLVVRKALELASLASFSAAMNPLDHIRRIVTVNSPHQGTGIAKTDQELEGVPEYEGLRNFFTQATSTNSDELLVKGKVEIDLSQFFGDYCEDDFWGEKALCWLGGQSIDYATSTLHGRLTAYLITGSDHIFKFPFAIKGSLLGSYTVDYGYPNFPQEKGFTGSPEAKTQLLVARAIAITAQTAYFGPGYTPGRMSEYLRRTNGKFIEVLPFYSENSQSMSRMFAREIANKIEEGNPCSDGGSIQDKACRAVNAYLRANVSGTLEGMLMGEGPVSYQRNTVTVNVAPRIPELLKELERGWLKSSDMVVEGKSQRWDLTVPKNDPETGLEISELHRPVTYALHNAEVPVGHPRRPVLHTQLSGLMTDAETSEPLQAFTEGAPLMGRDLFCGLEPACSKLLGRGRDPIYAGAAVRQLMPSLQPSGELAARETYTQTVRLQDDFEIYPQILGGTQSGVAIQDALGQNLAVVNYDPAVGTWIWTAGVGAGTVSIVMAPERRPQFVVKRVGQNVSVDLIAQNGSTLSRPLVTTTDRELGFVAMGDGLATSSVALIGEAKTVDPELQMPQVAWGSVRPILQERGGDEANQSRPWMWVVNTSDRVLKDLKLSYYFTADPAQDPKVVMDYPVDLAVSKEHLGGNLWAFHVSIPELPRNMAWPQSGMQNRLHYREWGEWARQDDPSIGTEWPSFSQEIVIRDAQGRILWGTPPKIPQAADPAPEASVEATWRDAARSDELNMIRPAVALTNTAPTALPKGYKVVLRVGGLLPAIVPALSGYHHPDNEATILRESDGTLRVEWTYANRDLEPGQTLPLGEWAIHWTGYEAFQKSALTYQVQVLDAEGKLLWTQGEVGPTPVVDPVDPTPTPGSFVLGATWRDAASEGERNTIRPDLQIRNLSEVPLARGWKVKLKVSGMESVTATPNLVGDYHPQNTGTLVRAMDGSLDLEWTFGVSELGAGQNLDLGQWRLHWSDWQEMDKSKVRYTLQVVDAQGRVLLDNEQVTR